MSEPIPVVDIYDVATLVIFQIMDYSERVNSPLGEMEPLVLAASHSLENLLQKKDPWGFQSVAQEGYDTLKNQLMVSNPTIEDMEKIDLLTESLAYKDWKSMQ